MVIMLLVSRNRINRVTTLLVYSIGYIYRLSRVRHCFSDLERLIFCLKRGHVLHALTITFGIRYTRFV